MKMLHRLQSQTAGPAWGLAFGILMSAAGLVLWFHAGASPSVAARDQSVSVGAVLLGVLLTVYASRELGRKRHR